MRKWLISRGFHVEHLLPKQTISTRVFAFIFNYLTHF